MKPDKLPSFQDMAPVLDVITSDTLPLELLVLKCHLVVEALMYHILSLRLQIERQQLPQLNYFPLTKLAFGGVVYSRTLVKVLALNDLRNEFGHELDSKRHELAYGAFVNKVGLFWPESDPFSKPAEFAAVRDAGVRAAASQCVGEAFCVFVDVGIARDAFPAEERDAALLAAAKIREVSTMLSDAQTQIRDAVQQKAKRS